MQNKETKSMKEMLPAEKSEEPKQGPSYKDKMANKLGARRAKVKQKK